MPAHVGVVVGGGIHLRGWQVAPQDRFGLLWRDQPLQLIDERIFHGNATGIDLDLARNGFRGFVPVRRADR